ncbi:MAG: YczE/YyaS/YitT family protein [Actinomycetes bacterium]
MQSAALRSPRSWAILILGVVCAGIAVALLLDSAFGVAPVDAVFAGISRQTGISVGTALIAACIALVAFAWLLGVKPGLGTVVSFFGIGLAVDATTWLLDVTGWSVSDSAWQVRLLVWLVAAPLLGFAAACMYSSGLGASPYDLFVQSLGRFHLSIPVARVIIDGAMLLVAFLIGGAWGIGTVGLMLAIPLFLKLFLPLVGRFAPHQSFEHPARTSNS